jgi:hypothetical protein
MVPHFCGASAHIGLLELPRTSVSGHHGQTGVSLDVGVTLAGSSDENLDPTTGMCVRPLTVFGYVCLPRKGGSSVFSQMVHLFFLKKNVSQIGWDM